MGNNQKMKTDKVEDPEVFYGSFGKYESSFTDPIRMVVSANNGLPATSFDDLIRVSHQSRELFANRLNISIKTLERYKKEHKPFDAIMGELILKWLQLYRLGFEVFGSVKAFNRWLGKPAYGLQGHCPDDLINTSGGIDLVTEELHRISHGDLA